MAVSGQVSEYLRRLYERGINPPEPIPGMDTVGLPAGAVAPGSIAAGDEGDFSLPLSSLATGEEIPSSATVDDISRLERAGWAAQGFKRKDAAPPDSEPPSSYLSALESAQRQDELAAMAARTMAPAEEIARILSRGAYRPSGVSGLPSATEQLSQRQKAVQEMLAAKRGERAEMRQEQAAEQDIELNRAQIARQNAMMEADKLRLAMEQGEAPYKVQELQANVRKALAQAQLAEETAKAKGRPVVVVARPAKEPKEPKAPPAEKLRQLPTTTIEELSGFDPALRTLKNLTDYYKTLNLSGFISRTAAKLGESAPEKVLLYEAAAAPVRQAVGVILEKGKLAEGDISRYKQMMPKPGDSEAVVDKKLETLTNVLNDIRASKVRELRGAGFQVGEQAPQAPVPPAGIAPSKEDAARAAVAAFKAAQAAGADAATLERLRSEAQKAVDAVKPTGG